LYPRSTRPATDAEFPKGSAYDLKNKPNFFPAPSSLGGGAVGAGEEGGVRSEVVTVVGGLFIADPFGLCLSALIMFAGVVELAIAAGMQVGVALGADVERAHSASGWIRNLLAAFPTVEKHSYK
jgi:hypothetical protein